MRQAAFEGVVDFSKARLSDRSWWKWLHSRLDMLESRHAVEVYRIRHAENLAVLPMMNTEGIEKRWDQAQQYFTKIFNRFFPWMKEDESSDRDKSVADLNQLWTDTWGDPNDPAVQERIMATARSLTKAKTRRK